MTVIGRDEHRIVVLQCDECGEPRAGCRAVDCALSSRPYSGEDVVPVKYFRGAVEALRNLYEDFRAGGQQEATERVRMELAALGIETEPYGGR